MAKQFIKQIIKRSVPKWTVDRIEEGWAVLCSAEENINIPIKQLGKDVKIGDTFIRQNGRWFKNDAETAERQKRIEEKFARIKGNL